MRPSLKKSPLSLLPVLVGLFCFSCTDNTDIEPKSNPTSNDLLKELDDRSNSNARLNSSTEELDWIDFESLPPGTIVSEIYGVNGAGPVKVYGVNPQWPNMNAAMIFNSNRPTGSLRSRDLGTPNVHYGGAGIGDGGEPDSPYANSSRLHNILIVSRDFDTSDPDPQNAVGTRLIFNFSELGGAAVHYLQVIDIDDVVDAVVRFYDASGDLIGDEFILPQTGDNGVHLFTFSTFEGFDSNFHVVDVDRMEVWLNGEAAIGMLVFTPAYAGCTSNAAYWKNHSKYSKQRDPTWDEIHVMGEDGRFFLAGATYYEVMNTAPKGGNVYYMLAQEFIAADLNYHKGAYANAAVKNAYLKTDSLLRIYSPSQIAALDVHDPLREELQEYASTFKQYNNGQIGPGGCKR